MADREETRPGDSNFVPGEIRQRLDRVASGIDVRDRDRARMEVDRVVGRRRARKRISAALGAAAVVAVAATTVVLMSGDDQADTLVITDDTTPPDTTALDTDDTVDSPQPTLAVATAQPVELIGTSARPGAVAGANGAPEYGEWIVPWEDGFLVGSTSFPPQPLPDELPEDVRALFPQEVIDFFDGELPDTVAEATEQLSQAGLLETVSEIIQANPAAYDAIYGVPSGAPTLDVRFTVDGADWEPREMMLPPGATYMSSVTAVGDRLAAVFTTEDPLTGQNIDGTVTVANTTDLINWSTQQIVVPSPGELPDGIDWRVSAQGLAANDDGWVVSVYDSIDADPYTLLPVDVRAEIDRANGFGMSTDGTGITIEYGFDADGMSPSETLTFTWDELGVDPEVGELLNSQTYESALWASTWDGAPASADGPAMGGLVAATPDGFLMWADRTWFSPDGITWESSPLSDDAGWVTGAFNVDGGMVVMSSTNDGVTQIHRVDDRGRNAVLLDVPLPVDRTFSVAGLPGGSYASGVVVMADRAMVPDPDPDVDPDVDPGQQLTAEADGYRLTLIQQTGVFEVVDVASGEVIVSERPVQLGHEDSPIRFDEAGVTVTDAATGEVLVVFSRELLDTAEREFLDGGGVFFEDGGREYDPDLWLLASPDGRRFVVEDIADVTDGPTVLATNAGRLLLQSGSDWAVFDIA